MTIDKRYDADKDKTEEEKPTRKGIEQALIELNAEGKQPGRKALQAKGINQYWIQKLIPEGLTKLKEQLGLKISAQERPLSDDELFKKIDDFLSNSERITWAGLRRYTGITDKVFNQRFGKKGIFGVISEFRKWLEEYQPKSKNIELVDAYLKGQVKTKTPRSQLVKRKELTTKIKWQNLNYEPTNEQGVVFLFGMVSWALGFSIEYIGDDFPDCEAKRYVEGKRKRQQHVRIEFKHKSREYNYPVEDCDIIVCWEDNWGNDCPLEVIELRTEIERLRKSSEFSNR